MSGDQSSNIQPLHSKHFAKYTGPGKMMQPSNPCIRMEIVALSDNEKDVSDKGTDGKKEKINQKLESKASRDQRKWKYPTLKWKEKKEEKGWIQIVMIQMKDNRK